MKIASDGLNLVSQAKLTATGHLVNLDNRTLSITNGSLFRVGAGATSGSLLDVTGNLVALSSTLTNSSTLNVTGGALVNVIGGSVFRLTGGSLGAFSGLGTNTINLTNNTSLCGGCSITTVGGVSVLLKNSASAGNITVTSGFVPFSGTGSVNVTGASGAHLILDGSASKIKLSP